MPTTLQFRRGNTAVATATTGANGEIFINTTTKQIHVHDGSTAGGFALANATSVAAAYSNAVTYTDNAVAALVNTAPAALNTLQELAAALGNDASFSTTVLNGIGNAYSNAIAYSASNTYVNNTFAPKASPTFTGTITIPTISANGSTGTSGQVLTSNGIGVYWANAATGGSVNTSAAYIWSNTHSFYANTTFESRVFLTNSLYANGTVGTAGQVLTTDGVKPYWATPATGGGVTLASPSANGSHYLPMSLYANGSWTTGIVDTNLKFDVDSSRIWVESKYEAGKRTAISGGQVYIGDQSNGSNKSISIFPGRIDIDGSPGNTGQVLTSNGSGVYWSTPAAGGVNLTSGANVAIGNATSGCTFITIDGTQLQVNTSSLFTKNATFTDRVNLAVSNNLGWAAQTSGSTTELKLISNNPDNFFTLQGTNNNVAMYAGYYGGARGFAVSGSNDGGTAQVLNNGYGQRVSLWSQSGYNAIEMVGYPDPNYEFVIQTGFLNQPAVRMKIGTSYGNPGDVLTSGGSANTIYWAPAAASVNASASYTWTGNHTFNANTTANNTLTTGVARFTGNTQIQGRLRDTINSTGTSGQVLTSTGTGVLWSTLAVNLNITKSSFTGNGANTEFTLETPATADSILVYVNGMYYHPGEDYTVNSNTNVIAFTQAPADQSKIRIRYFPTTSAGATSSGDLMTQTGVEDLMSSSGAEDAAV